jgi:quercetin dioxygenase-like cupin family protein
MRKHALDAVARATLDDASRAAAHRAAETVVGGHETRLRQTVIALRAGAELAEHDNPGEATLQVLKGRIVLRAGADSWDGRTGDLIEIPQSRHSVSAVEDSAVLFTAVPHNG